MMAVPLLRLVSSSTLAQEAKQWDGKDSLRPKDIFRFTKIWTVHLRFTPEQWEAMAPRLCLKNGKEVC